MRTSRWIAVSFKVGTIGGIVIPEKYLIDILLRTHCSRVIRQEGTSAVKMKAFEVSSSPDRFASQCDRYLSPLPFPPALDATASHHNVQTISPGQLTFLWYRVFSQGVVFNMVSAVNVWMIYMHSISFRNELRFSLQRVYGSFANLNLDTIYLSSTRENIPSSRTQVLKGLKVGNWDATSLECQASCEEESAFSK
jgi:hypothetical protein